MDTSGNNGPSEGIDCDMDTSSANGPDVGYEPHQPDMGYKPHQPNYGYEDASPITTPAQPDMAGYGYEDHRPPTRRVSMTQSEEKQRRASIKAIMGDNTKSPMTKRLSIQHLMDGRRNSLSNNVDSVLSSNNSQAATELSYTEMGYGDQGTSGTILEHCVVIEPRCDEQTKRDEEGRPPCPHYDRKCTMIAPCCGAAFGCRICHDDCPVLPPKIETLRGRRFARSASMPSSFTTMGPQMPEDNHHQIDRFAVKEIICRECYTRQSSKTNNCVGCGVQFGSYHCSICNLWMTNEENPYHCTECGFCRVGGAENFKHCHACGMCIDRNLYASHNCNEGKYKSNCPVCQEFMFSSRSASHEMPCGHAIHWDCFRQLAAHDSRCPVCKKTAETRERMLPTWNAMAQNIALQPVPPELARVVNITCNDCEQSCDAQAWHFLGVRCIHCQSFNTVVSQIVLTGEEAHEFLAMNAFRQAINEARANGESRPRRRVNRRRSAI